MKQNCRGTSQHLSTWELSLLCLEKIVITSHFTEHNWKQKHECHLCFNYIFHLFTLVWDDFQIVGQSGVTGRSEGCYREEFSTGTALGVPCVPQAPLMLPHRRTHPSFAFTTYSRKQMKFAFPPITAHLDMPLKIRKSPSRTCPCGRRSDVFQICELWQLQPISSLHFGFFQRFLIMWTRV